MGILSGAITGEELSNNFLTVIYGKSNSGKTSLAATFPKPMLHVKIGDDGRNAIKDVKGIQYISADTLSDLTEICKEVLHDKTFKSVVYDTFSMVVEMWKKENLTDKKGKMKKMTQPDWGELMNETNTFIRSFAEQAKNKYAIVTGHEILEALEGLEDELLPDGRIAINKGSRTYLEGIANLGLHTTRIQKEKTDDEGNTKTLVKFAVDIGPNVFYWTKCQTTKNIKLPSRIINPTYDKIMAVLEGGK